MKPSCSFRYVYCLRDITIWLSYSICRDQEVYMYTDINHVTPTVVRRDLRACGRG